MSGERGNAKLGGLLSDWEAGATKTAEEIAQAFETLDVCGGALLYLTRAEAKKIEESGAGFDTDPYRSIPEDGRGNVRVRCRARVSVKTFSEEIPESDQRRTRTVRYGLCDRCGGWEYAIRKRLRDAAKEAEQAAKTGPRRRGFREEAAE